MPVTTDFNLPAESVLSADLHDRLPDIAAYRRRCMIRDVIHNAITLPQLYAIRNTLAPRWIHDDLLHIDGIWGCEFGGTWTFCLRRATTHQFPANDWHQFASVQEIDGQRRLIWLP